MSSPSKRVRIEHDSTSVYTATTAFLEALTVAGVQVCFCNLGSDHPSFVEAIAIYKAKQSREGAIRFPEFISVTHEMVALSAAQGYYQATGKMAALLLHVDCGLINAGGALHNVYRARIPVIVFAGLSAITLEGEMRGSRTEFINWVQDVHDQAGIVRNYSKYTYEIRTGKNIGQVTMRAAQIALSEPKGPVFLMGAREVMEESLPLPPVNLNLSLWQPVRPRALLPEDAKDIAALLLRAKAPLAVSSWCGNSQTSSEALYQLCETLAIPYLDSAPFALNFPTTHYLYQGSHWSGGGQHPLLAEADVVVIIDSDVPYIPCQNKPSSTATVIHLDSDPLKIPMPLFYISAQQRYAVDSAIALGQINNCISEGLKSYDHGVINSRRSHLRARAAERQAMLQALEKPQHGLSVQEVSVALASLRKALPHDTLIVSEAISNYGKVFDHLGLTESRRLVTSGASSLGYGGGAAVGAKIGIKAGDGKTGPNTFVCMISGDGSYMFSIPSTVHHMASKNSAPFLSIILCNGGWKSPKLSTLLVYPRGYASALSADDLGVGFGPLQDRPSYAALAVASAGGEHKAWGARVNSGASEMLEIFQRGVSEVQNGKSAIIEVIIPEI